MNGVLLEALEVFINQILYTRGVYPAQIFQKQRVYNTPVHTCIYPVLNNYIRNVLKTAKELLDQSNAEEALLQKLEISLYYNELFGPVEKYVFALGQPAHETITKNDEYLLDFEEQLRSSLYKLAERINGLPKLTSNIRFKILLHTSQVGFMKITHNSQYQDFPWLHESTQDEHDRNKNISLLPLARLGKLGLQLSAEIF